MTTSAFGIDHGDVSKGMMGGVATAGRKFGAGFKIGGAKGTKIKAGGSLDTASAKVGQHLGANKGKYALGSTAVAGGGAMGAHHQKKKQF